MVVRIFYILFTLFLFISCAKQGMPPGGPKDTTPPEILRTEPSLGKTMVHPNTSVMVRFSEPINPASAKDAIFISPYPGTTIKYRWRGRNLKIYFPKPLETNRTYVVTLGTAIRDYRNNPMKSSFTLAFSTGAVLDRGKISGKVCAKGDQHTVDIWAYQVTKGGTPNPSIEKPDYLIQCSADGSFQLTNLAPFHYRLFAIRDRAGDRLYQPVEDAIGVPFCDVKLDSETNIKVENIFFRMSQADTLSPSLVRSILVNKNHVVCQFNEPVDISNKNTDSPLTIVSVADSMDTLSIEFYYIDPMNAQFIHLYTTKGMGNTNYKIQAVDIMDASGNPIDSAYNTLQFSGTAEADTARPELIQSKPAFKEKTVNLVDPIQLSFSEAIDSTQIRNGLTLKDSADQTVDGTMKWLNPAVCYFYPDSALMNQSHYQLALSGKGIQDLSGNGLADTVIFFRTINSDTLSEIAGTISDPDTTGQGAIYIMATQITNPEVKYTTSITEPGPYRIQSVLPGKYLIDAFRDENGNGKYSYGFPYPFTPAERFCIYPDTVKIRSRWPNEGNDLSLPCE